MNLSTINWGSYVRLNHPDWSQEAIFSAVRQHEMMAWAFWCDFSDHPVKCCQCHHRCFLLQDLVDHVATEHRTTRSSLRWLYDQYGVQEAMVLTGSQ